MKNLIFVILIGITFVTQAQPVNRTFESADGRINLLGLTTVDGLKQVPFEDWYQESHKEYEVNADLINSTKLSDSITIFMGTWCGDSRREVPRFIKMLELKAYDFSKLKIVCLNTGFQNYKQSPEREEQGVNIHRVPTFIFHDERGEEIGRIVEEPVASLEKDLADVLLGNDYETAYPVANDLIEKFDRINVKELKKMTSELIETYKGKSVGVYELNTYGFVLWSSWDLTKAEFVLELNTKLYPDEVITHRTLARFKTVMGKRKEAMTCIKEGLKLEPENKDLISMKEGLSE